MSTIRVMRCLGVAFLVFGFCFGLSGESMASQIILRLGDEMMPDNPINKANKMLARLVKQRTNGRVVIEHYGGGSLGKGKKLIESCLVGGGVDIADSGDGNLSDFSDNLDFIGLPYLISSIDEYAKFWHSDLGKKVTKEVEKDIKGKLLIYFESNGCPRDLWHNAPKVIKLPKDLEGLKIRTTGAKPEVAVLKAWGARPTPIDWGEVYLALQQKVVDGTYNGSSGMYLCKMHEVAKSITALNANWIVEFTFIADRAWNKLSKEDQKIMLEAAREAEESGRKLNREFYEWAKRELIKECQYYFPTAEEEAVWRKRAEATWDQFVGPNKRIKSSFIKDVKRVLGR